MDAPRTGDEEEAVSMSEWGRVISPPDATGFVDLLIITLIQRW